MLRKTALSEVSVGTTFEAWNHKYTVLNKENNKIFVLAAEIETMMQFRKNIKSYTVAPNDFRDSSIRNWLNNDYLGILQKNRLKNDDILDLEIDLLTLEEYGKYYDVIPCVDSPWWLATPWRTPSRSTSTGRTASVWYVGSGGGYDRWYCSDAGGVRPALNLSPSLLVVWEDKSCTEDSSN